MFRRLHAKKHNDMLSSPSKYKATRARQKLRGMIHNMHRRRQSWARCFLWALLAVSVIVFWCITLVRPTAWYRDDTGGHFRAMWQTLELRNTLGAGTSAPPIMRGMLSTQVVLQWGATLTAALSVIALKSIQQRSPIPRPSPAQHKLALQARRLWCSPLLPTQLWQWLCGGLNALDGTLVLFWITLQLTWVVASVLRKLPSLRAAEEGGFSTRSYPAGIYLATAQSFGWAASTDLLLLFYPVPRNTFLHWLFHTDFPGLIKYHRWLGHGFFLMITIHGSLYYAYWAATSQWIEQTFDWNHEGVNRLAGSIAWIAGLTLQLTATQYVRRRWYTVFYTSHIVGFICLMMFAFIHYQSMWAYTLPGFVLYLMDVTFRLAQQMHWAPASSASRASSDSTLATLRLRWHHAAELVPSQILWINIPSLSKLHWHPVSIAHVELDDPKDQNSDGSVTVHFKAYGAWTKGLIGKLSKGDLPLVKASGPFGCPQGPKWAAHRVLVIFAGGIGITPMLGMLRHMASSARAKKADPHSAVGIPDKVYLIWSSRSDSELQLLDRDLIDLARQDEAWLSIQLHCTAKHTAVSSSAETAEPGAVLRDDPGAGLLTGFLSSHDPSNLHEKALSRSAGHPRVFEPGRQRQLPSNQLQHEAQQRALVSYGFGDLHWAATHVVSMAGAFCAGVAVYGFRAAHDDVAGWQVGFLLFLATCVMTAGAASLVILPVHLHRYWYQGQKAHHKGPAFHAAFHPVPLDSDEEPVDQKVSHLEAQDNIEVIRSRPDAALVLGGVMAAHSQTAEISVFVAGPQALYANVKEVCAGINKGPAQQGKPYLSVHRQAYNL